MPWLYTACGHCSYCWSGWETLCEAQKNTGYSVNGAFAEYVVADANYVGQLPLNVEFVQIAPILCAGITVYKGLKVSAPTGGLGCGLGRGRSRAYGRPVRQGDGDARRCSRRG